MLQRLKLTDYRNYERLDLAFAPGITVLVGDNGQGKTNILEAVYFLSILRSFRTNRIRDLNRWTTRGFTIYGEVEVGEQVHRLGLEYQDRSRRLRVNGDNIKRASDFIGRFFAVAFIPEDIELVKGSASDRRRFLDISLSQLQPGYLTSLQQYDRALKSRNALLRDSGSDAAARAFDQILAREGAAIIDHRNALFDELKEVLEQTSRDLLPAASELQIRYQPSISGKHEDSREQEILQVLASNRERDRLRGLTHAGPHRDDFTFRLDGKPLGSFGSEGQCRLAALSLKLAKARYFLDRKDAGEVILLIDDVIGELDQRGRQAFLGTLRQARQVLLACTGVNELPAVDGMTLLRVKQGTVLTAV